MKTFKSKMIDFTLEEYMNEDFVTKLAAEASLKTSLDNIQYVRKLVFNGSSRFVMNYIDPTSKKYTSTEIKLIN